MQTVDIQEKAIEVLVSTIHRGIAFYLALTAVLTGYVLSQADKLSHDIRVAILNLEILLSFCMYLVFCAGAWALLRAVSNLNSALLNIDEHAYMKSRFGEAHKTMRTMICIALVITLIGCIAFIAVLIYLRKEVAT